MLAAFRMPVNLVRASVSYPPLLQTADGVCSVQEQPTRAPVIDRLGIREQEQERSSRPPAAVT